MEGHRERMAARIRQERLNAGLSEAELAWKISASERQVRRWEAGDSEPRPANLRALAKQFKLQITDIRPDVDEEERAVLAQLNRIEAKLNALLAATTPAAAPRGTGVLPVEPLRPDSYPPTEKPADANQNPPAKRRKRA